jgi:hypothetical protein
MNRKLAVRLIIDISMTVLLLCAYAYRITGDIAHEWIGVAVFVLCAAHNVINYRWYKNMFSGAYNARRLVMTAVNALLALLFTALIVTGLLMSRTVLSFLRLQGDMTLRLIHTTSAYWLLPLIGIHIGLHWGMIMNTIGKIIKISEKSQTRTIVLRIAAVAIVALGAWSFFDRDMYSKLFLGFSFDYWPEERWAAFFFIAMLSIISLYVSVAYYALKIWERRRG